MTIEEDLQARMARRPDQLETAREFLQTFISDADRSQYEQAIRYMLTVNPFSIENAADAITGLLTTPQPAGLLVDLVARYANRALRDPSDEGARTWLEKLVADVREWTRESAAQGTDG